MVRVADCIMGTGKSSAAITYMNEHPDKKFIYITPFLEEAARIAGSCPCMNFVEPSDKIEEYNYRKRDHAAALIEVGKNISSTHQSFENYTPEMLAMIKEQGYTLVIDECVDVLVEYNINADDLRVAVNAGIIKEENGVYTPTGKPYNGTMFRDMMYMMQSRELITISDTELGTFFYWTLAPSFITSFDDVFILTYLFEAQSLHHMLEMYDIPYERIGVARDDDGTYRFCEYPGYIPEYVHNIENLVHIYENEKMNSIGAGYHDLSMNWHKKSTDDMRQLKDNIYNFFNNVHRDIPSNQRLWGTYKDYSTKLRGKGYSKRFLPFNARATNKYRNCNAVVYDANVFMNASERNFYKKHGVKIDECMYSLSVLCQFLWRSAIREGNDIYLYLPSSRMRTILKTWMHSFNTDGQEGGIANDL